ncbi:MAG: hypothetical protein P1V20_27200 [Verrucomicrobiales bacterium]|nr:hypothetical protein [Verrucomicrobiales bacterium]
MREILFPRFSLKSFGILLALTAAGALMSGVYGIIHDQITYSLSPEYFTRFKFFQFYKVDPGMGERIFAGVIGFLATWWIGAILGWSFGRLSMTKPSFDPHPTEVIYALILALTITAAGGLAGYLYASSRLDQPRDSWDLWKASFQIEDMPAFHRVGIIHNMGYIGGAVGAVIAGVRLRRKCS